MKNSISRKYFVICFVSVLVSIIILGIIFLGFSTRFFEKDKYGIMKSNTQVAANITSEAYTMLNGFTFDSRIYNDRLVALYTVLANASGSDIFVVNGEGKVIFHSNNSKKDYDNMPLIPLNIIEQTYTKGYQKTGVIPGITNQPSYVVGAPVMVDNIPVGVVFSTSSADNLIFFLQNMIKMFMFSALIVLLIAFLLIYYVTSKMVKPLRQMVDATHSFSKGDFTKRITVNSKDEVGQLGNAFNEMASALAINENSRRSFIANVSHELKTPMTTIGGFVDGVLDGTIPPEKQEEYLTIVSLEAKRLTRLVHSMLDTARIEAGEMQLKLTVFDISELVRQSIFTFEQKVEEKHLEINGLEEDHVMVCADKDLIHQVVYNLIENAVKFVDDGGSITVSYKKEGNKLYTKISNTGDGLSQDETRKIFERFYKSDRSRTGSVSGVGLGLHIVKSIIKYHDGEITVNSVKGESTDFTFAIDVAKENN